MSSTDMFDIEMKDGSLVECTCSSPISSRVSGFVGKLGIVIDIQYTEAFMVVMFPKEIMYMRREELTVVTS